MKPIPASLEGAPPWGGICFAVQCKLRGWDDLATAAYAECRNNSRPSSSDTPAAIAELRWAAWSYWESQLAERHSNRKEAFAQLSELAKWAPGLVTGRKQYLLPDLKTTLVPRKSKSGSVEEIIDGLTDHWDDPEDWDNDAGRVAFWKLAELGLDAVPALLEHLDDVRLTRATSYNLKNPLEPYVIRVNQLVEYILNNLSGGRFASEHYLRTAAEWKEPKDHKWWAEARKLGEEKWLIENVLPKDEEYESSPNKIILRVIRVKYPHRLKDVYQEALLKQPLVNSESVTKAVLASKLPAKEKIAILEQGATNKNYNHRVLLLEAIAKVDTTVFRKYLLQMLASAPPELKLSRNERKSELLIVSLIRKTDDRKCWDALTDLSRRARRRQRECSSFAL